MIFYTDGSCLGNPGKGAFAWVETSGKFRSVSGVYPDTTNNRMELMAPISLLLFCVRKRIKKALIYSDSMYLVKGFNIWSNKWFSLPSSSRKILNLDLWKILHSFKELLDVKLNWVPGHSDSIWNNLAHNLCNKRVR